MHPYQTPCQGVYSIRTAIHTTYVRTLQVHDCMTIFNIQIQHWHWFPWHHWPTIDPLWDLRTYVYLVGWLVSRVEVAFIIYQTFFCSIPFHYCCTNKRTWNTQTVTSNGTEAEPNRLLWMRMLLRDHIGSTVQWYVLTSRVFISHKTVTNSFVTDKDPRGQNVSLQVNMIHCNVLPCYVPDCSTTSPFSWCRSMSLYYIID